MSKKTTKDEDVYKVYPVEGKIQIRTKKRFNYNEIISLLLEGGDIFLEIDRRQAYYLRKQIEKRIGELVEAYPAYMDGMDGYMFKLSMVKEFLSRKMREEEKI